MISIVIPVHNESGNISCLVKGIVDVLSVSSFSYEIIVVDDASTDDTLVVLENLMSYYDELRVLSHKNNCGQSTALYSGIKAAKEDIIITMDGDGQNDPSDIPFMVNSLLNSDNEKLKMVAGHRVKRNDSKWRKFSSQIANKVRCSFLNDDTPDTGCGLKVFYRDIFLCMPYFDHMHRFLPALVKRQGYDVESVPVNHFERRTGSSHYGTIDRLMSGIVDLLGVFWLNRRACLPLISECERDER